MPVLLLRGCERSWRTLCIDGYGAIALPGQHVAIIEGVGLVLTHPQVLAVEGDSSGDRQERRGRTALAQESLARHQGRVADPGHIEVEEERISQLFTVAIEQGG